MTAGAVLVGASSWSDSSLTQDSGWYPKKTMKAVERIAHYAARFPIVEMENNYRFPPTVAVTQQWAERTPEGFTFDIPAWSLLTQQPTFPPSLYEDLVQEVSVDRRDRPKLYSSHLSTEAFEECWKRFVHSLRPLMDSGKLGSVLLRYPRWFVPRDANREVLERTRYFLGETPASVELTCGEWVAAESCEATFSLLEDLDFGFVNVDAHEDNPRGLNQTSATTNDIAVLRMLGRRERSEDDSWGPDWRSYRYSDDELRGVLPRLRHLADGAREVHVLFSTCWRDDAVDNAERLQPLIEADPELTLTPRLLRSAG